MKRGFLAGFVTAASMAGLAAASWWMATVPKPSSSSPPPPQPATVPKTIKDDQLNLVTLNPQADRQIGVQLGRVERRRLRRERLYGAEVTVPAGRTFVVASPLAGILRKPPQGIPAAGSPVRQGQVVLELLPLLTPEGRANLAVARAEARGQVQNAEAQKDAALVVFNRATELHKSGVGSQRAVDEANAQLEVARKTLAAATARLNALDEVAREVEKGTAAPLPILAPSDGLLRAVNVREGESVPAGGTLFEVVDLSRIWLRVPIYVGELPEVDTSATALVVELTGNPGQFGCPAAPVVAPPTANPAAGTADLYFAMENWQDSFRPGERVGVKLALKGEAESLTVPWAAVIHDVHGGTWVYQQVAERAYARRRVVVRQVIDAWAVLETGPEPGTVVVVAGAAELFGTETGFSK